MVTNKDKIIKIFLPLLIPWFIISIYLVGCLDTFLGLNTVRGAIYQKSYGFLHMIRYVIGKDKTWPLVGIVFLAGAFCIYYLLSLSFKEKNTDERDFIISKSGTYGTSGWMTEEERQRVLDVKYQEETDGIILGMIGDKVVSLPKPKPNKPSLNRHIAAFGTSGSRKSRGFVIPMVMQSVVNGESIILSDPKGDVYKKTSQYLRDNEYDVKILNLVEPNCSDSWAILFELGEPDEHQTNAHLMADIIMKNTENLDRLDFWAKGELNLLKALILYVFRDPNRPEYSRSIGAVYDLISNTTEKQLNQIFDTLPAGHPAIAPYNIFRKGNDTVREGVFFGLGTRLQLFQDERIKRITSYREIDLTAPAKKKCAYFIKTSDQDTTMTFIQSLFFSFLFIRLVRYADSRPDEKCDVPVNIILDEFVNCGVIPDFNVKMSTVRSRDIRISIIFQMITQLQTRYKDTWDEILANCDTHYVLGVNDDATAKFISERSGEVTTEYHSNQVIRKSLPVSDVINTYKDNVTPGKRYLLTKDEVIRTFNVTSDEALVIIRGEKLLKVKKYDYSLHSHAALLVPSHTSSHIPEWRKRLMENEKPNTIEQPGNISIPCNSTTATSPKPRVLQKISIGQPDLATNPMLPPDIPDVINLLDDVEAGYNEPILQEEPSQTVKKEATDPKDFLQQYVKAVQDQAKELKSSETDTTPFVSEIKNEGGKKLRTLSLTKLNINDSEPKKES